MDVLFDHIDCNLQLAGEGERRNLHYGTEI